MVEFLPRVRAADRFGNPVAALPVTYTIASGNGAITGATTVTDADGMASLGSWSVGGPGWHSVIAASPSVPPQTFSILVIESVDPACGHPRPLPYGQTVESDLAVAGCRTAMGRSFETYEIAVATSTGISLTMTSSTSDNHLELYSADGTLLGRSINGPGFSAMVRAYLPQGRYITGATSTGGNEGAYSIARGGDSAVNAQCDTAYAIKGARVIGEIQSSTCRGRALQHTYRVRLKQGERIRITLQDQTYSAWQMSIVNSSGREMALAQTERPYVERIDFVASTAGSYLVHVSSVEDGAAYLMSID